MTLPELEYLWQEKADQDIATELHAVLLDVDAITRECDALFTECVPGVDLDSENALMSFGQLHAVTQRLIDRFGSRDPMVLAEIADLYRSLTTSCQDAKNIGVVDFRGFVTTVLTHVMRELELRAQGNGDQVGQVQPRGGQVVEDQNQPKDDRSIAQTLSDMLVGVGGSLF